MSINTVSKLLIDAGKACATFHDEKVRGVKSRRVQVDEIWSFTAAKQKNVAGMKAPVDGAGDTWTWTAIDADTKLLITWLVGGRDSDYAIAFMDDLRDRLANRVQLTSDGHRAYLEAVEGAFGGDVDYAMLVKIVRRDLREVPRAAIAPLNASALARNGSRAIPIRSTFRAAYAERQNLTMRMQMRRFTRLTNAFSKKFENHMHMVALYTVWYNFVKQHKSLKGLSPAMAAGISETLWSMTDLAEMIDAACPSRGSGGRTRGRPYEKHWNLDFRAYRFRYCRRRNYNRFD